LVPLQLPLSPMMVFAIGIEYALDVAVLESAALVNVLRRSVLRRRREKIHHSKACSAAVRCL
jgi:hypothetical protein